MSEQRLLVGKNQDPLLQLGQAFQEYSMTGKLTAELRAKFENAIKLADDLHFDELRAARTAAIKQGKSLLGDIYISTLNNLLESPTTCRKYYANVLTKSGEKLTAMRYLLVIEKLAAERELRPAA